MEAVDCAIYEGYIQAARDALALPEFTGVDEGLDYMGLDEAVDILSDLVRYVRVANLVDFYEPWPERVKPSKAQRAEAQSLVRDLNARYNREWRAMEARPESSDDDLFAGMPIPTHLLACAGNPTAALF